jgi:hypothetical protein
MKAADMGYLGLVKLLVESGAEVNSKVRSLFALSLSLSLSFVYYVSLFFFLFHPIPEQSWRNGAILGGSERSFTGRQISRGNECQHQRWRKIRSFEEIPIMTSFFS